jgi:hypothetical protein
LPDLAHEEGEARIKRKHRQICVINPQPKTASPLGIEGPGIDVDTVRIVALIRRGRERFKEDDPPQ